MLAGAGIEHELLSAAEAAARWPQIAFDTEVLWHPGAGVIDAETRRQHHGRSRRSGTGPAADRLGRSPAWTGPAPATGSLGSRGDIDAGNVVISAGGWLPGLLGELSLPAGFLAGLPEITVRQEQAFHFRYRDAALPPVPGVAHVHP